MAWRECGTLVCGAEIPAPYTVIPAKAGISPCQPANLAYSKETFPQFPVRQWRGGKALVEVPDSQIALRFPRSRE